MSPTCAVCVAAVATHHCANDDAFLCEACNRSIHSANVLSSRHRVITVQEYLQMNVEPSHSQHSASNTTPLQPVSVAPSSAVQSESHQVVPTMDPLSAVDAFKAFGSDFDLWGDLDNGWLDKFTAANGSGESWKFMESEAPGLVPQLDPTLLNAPMSAPTVPTSFPPPSHMECLSGFGVKMMSDDEDLDFAILVPVMQPRELKAFSAEEDDEDQQPPKATSAMRSNKASVARHNSAPAFQMPAAIVKVSKEQAAINRAERVALYRMKRKSRKFEKTIRYASRKAYAEVRPRIKGRFATPAEMEAMRAAAANAAVSTISPDDDDLLVVPCLQREVSERERMSVSENHERSLLLFTERMWE